MNEKINLFGLTRSEFEQIMTELGQKPYRGRQIYKWIYKSLIFDFDGMTDLGKKTRAVFKNQCCIRLPKILSSRKSADETEKFLFEMDDGSGVEAVLIPDEESGRMTLCVSSQAGCPLACVFCATGQLGPKRSLTVGEILSQPIMIRRLHGNDAFDNLVFMGMGEPLLNLDNVMAAIGVMTDSLGMMIGAKRITVSTAGVVPGIKKLSASGSKVNLALSLNAANDNLRSKLMPVAKSYPLEEVISAIRKWTEVRKRRVTFEYILFKDINDSEKHALELARLVQGIPCKINILAYNPIEGVNIDRPESETVERFVKFLYPRTPAVTVRKSRGMDIEAACGQLKRAGVIDNP
jgi:23S rRNA (adenine2503-C2)-methyltransferase